MVLNILVDKRLVTRATPDALPHYEPRVGARVHGPGVSACRPRRPLVRPDVVAASVVDVLAERDPECLAEPADSCGGDCGIKGRRELTTACVCPTAVGPGPPAGAASQPLFSTTALTLRSTSPVCGNHPAYGADQAFLQGTDPIGSAAWLPCTSCAPGSRAPSPPSGCSAVSRSPAGAGCPRGGAPAESWPRSTPTSRRLATLCGRPRATPQPSRGWCTSSTGCRTRRSRSGGCGRVSARRDRRPTG